MEWLEGRARLGGVLYQPLHDCIARLPADRWPELADLNALAEGIVTAFGKPLTFVPARAPGTDERRHYELRIAQAGEIETRPNSWHDLFNALAWIAYPHGKAAINAQHAAILRERGDEEARQRSPERDGLTLFDEGGVAVASSSPELLRLIVEFDWKTLFWQRRGALLQQMRFFAFGHALFEQALEPYIGMVAKTVFVPVDELFFMLPFEAQRERVDEGIAAHFAHRARFPSPKSMAPLPVLGIPDWHPQTATESFYDNDAYFRSKPRRLVSPGGERP